MYRAHEERLGAFADSDPHTPRDLHGCEKKGVAGKGICKSMKTKGRQFQLPQRHRSASTGWVGTEKIRGEEQPERDQWRRRKRRDLTDHGER